MQAQASRKQLHPTGAVEPARIRTRKRQKPERERRLDQAGAVLVLVPGWPEIVALGAGSRSTIKLGACTRECTQGCACAGHAG